MARVAENLVSTYDQNPQVHLPNQTVASNVEDKALRLLMDLLRLIKRSGQGFSAQELRRVMFLGWLAAASIFPMNASRTAWDLTQKRALDLSACSKPVV